MGNERCGEMSKWPTRLDRSASPASHEDAKTWKASMDHQDLGSGLNQEHLPQLALKATRGDADTN